MSVKYIYKCERQAEMTDDTSVY